MARIRTRAQAFPPPGNPMSFFGYGATFGERMSDYTGLHVDKPCDYSMGEVINSSGCITWTRTGGSSGVLYPAVGDESSGAGYQAYREPYSTGISVPACPIEDAMSSINREIGDYIREAGRSSFHAISFIREASETISMLKNPFKVLNFVKKFSGLNPADSKTTLKHSFKLAHVNSLVQRGHTQQSAKRLVDRASDTWLEGTYGWNPFVADMLAVAELAGGAISARKQLAASGPMKFRVTRSGSTSVECPGNTSDYTARVVSTGGRYSTTWKVVYYGTFTVNPSVQAESFVESAARAVNLDRLGYAVWDAVPYSFVVDWFFPLGNLIDDALSGPAFYSYATVPWISYRKLEVVTASMKGNPYYWSNYGVKYQGSATYGEKRRTFRRYQSNISDIATNSTTGMHGTRIASGLALAWGRLSRG